MTRKMREVALEGGYRLEVDDELDYRILNAKGKELASTPAKVRQNETWQRFVALRESQRRRVGEREQDVLRWIVAGQSLPGELLVTLMKDTSWRRALAGRFARSTSAGLHGLLLAGDSERGLGLLSDDLDTRWIGADASWTLVHVAELAEAELAKWRAVAADGGVDQTHLLRRVVSPEARELPEIKTDRYADRTISSAVRASYAFNHNGWRTTGGNALREMTVRGAAGWRRVTAEFNYFLHGDDYGDWAEECTTGALRFAEAAVTEAGVTEAGVSGAGELRPLRMREVPLPLYSEVCLDIERVLDRAQASSR